MQYTITVHVLVYGEPLTVPAGKDFIQALLNAELFVGRADNVGNGLCKVVQLHGKQVFQSEGLRVHVKVLPC